MNKIIFLLLFSVLANCQSQKKNNNTKKEYSRHVGDIEKDENIDTDLFKICNSENDIYQYFNNSKGLEYDGEKKEIIKIFNENFIPSKKKNQNGLIRIRFIVNCKGETGRFRITEMDNEYNQFQFDSNITKQLLKITKSLDGWVGKKYNNIEFDAYQYLIFRITNGNISKILP